MDNSAANFHLGYRRWLDGMRGIAILLVFAYHTRFLIGGSLGVDVFFVLSGFLITTLLVEEWQQIGSISLKRFYLRRALRLLPAFGVLLLACGILSFFLVPEAATALRKEMLVAGCYITNWQKLHGVNMQTLGHTWSLSIEEQFYLLWPPMLVFMLVKRFSRRNIILVVGLAILACALARAGIYTFHHTVGAERMIKIAYLYTALYSRADSLLMGCLVGLLATWKLLPQSRRFVASTGVASVVSVIFFGFLVVHRGLDNLQYYNGLFTVVAGMVAVVVVRLLAGPPRWVSFFLESAPLVGIGRISYALYLYQLPIIQLLKPAGLGPKFPRETVLVLALGFAAATASYYLIERPALRLKRRFRRVDGPPSAPPGPVAERADEISSRVTA